MNSYFEFATASRIIFGSGKVQDIGALALSLGNRAFVVLGFQNETSNAFLKKIDESGVKATSYLITKEPSIEDIQNACAVAKSWDCNLVIGLGGGSAIDTAKAVSILFTNPGNVLDYLEVIGKGNQLDQNPLACIAVPTTAGTGSEVTRNAVIHSPEHGVKVSLRSSKMLPSIALVDPALTLSLPPSVTASTGLDALTQVIEPFVTHLSNPFTDSLCREGIRRAGRSLQQAYRDGDDLNAREDMALVSLFGGLALANAKLGAVHGFAGVLGGMFPGPHGIICARLLPFTLAANVKALLTREPSNPALERFEETAKILTGDSNASVNDGVEWIQKISSELAVPSLTEFGMKQTDIPVVIEKSVVSSSMKGNPIQLTYKELEDILKQAL